MRRVVRMLLALALLLVVAALIWLRATPEGRELTDDLRDRIGDLRRGHETEDGIARLQALGVIVVRSQDQRVQSISATGKTLGDEGYQILGTCSRVEVVNLARCDIDDARMRHMADLVYLTSLGLIDAPNVTDAGLQHVAQLRRLAGLQLKGTQVTDAGLVHVARLPDLKSLDLTRTKVTDAGMTVLAGMRTLNWLILSDTEVTDDGVARLEGMTDLRQLTLSGSKVTAKGRAALKQMYPRLTID